MFADEKLALGLFNVFILGMLALDLLVFNRQPHKIGIREALRWSIFWIALSLLFNVLVYFLYEHNWLGLGISSQVSGYEAALQFFTGYLIEKALSVDNIFVFILIFSYFGVPAQYQHKVLFWGILGAIVMRLTFVVAGAALIARFEWILYIFGLILIASGVRIWRQKDIDVHPEKNMIIRLVRKWFDVREGKHPSDFFARHNHKFSITPLLIVLITVETTDVLFAVDSIPAVFGITRDPFIVYSSNMFAILGLRSLYFVLAAMMRSFIYLKNGLSIVLIFIGVKMLVPIHIPVWISLAIVVEVLAISIGLSVLKHIYDDRRNAKG